MYEKSAKHLGVKRIFSWKKSEAGISYQQVKEMMYKTYKHFIKKYS
jgi:hypothetical protein